MNQNSVENWLKVLGSLLIIDATIHIVLFYLARRGYTVTIPLALGVQVSLVSFLFVTGTLILTFFGISRMDDIKSRAMETAREAADAAVQKLAEEKAAMVPDDSARAPKPKADVLEGEEESEIE